MGGGCSTLSATRSFSRLPETDAEIAEELAADVDADGDGVLSEDELRAALKGEDGKKARRALLKNVWGEVDGDGNGTLDRDEVRAVLLRMGRTEEDLDLDGVMAVVDADGSGDVDFKEFEAWFLEQDLKSQVEAAKQLASINPTGKFEPWHVGRSGPTLIGRAAHEAALLRSKTARALHSKQLEPEPEPEPPSSFLTLFRKAPLDDSPEAVAEREAELEEVELDKTRWWWPGDGLWVTTRHHHLDDVGAIYYQIETDTKGKLVTIHWVDDKCPDFPMRSRINYIESGFPYPSEGTMLEGQGRWKGGPELKAKVFQGVFTAVPSRDGQHITWSDGDVWKCVATRNRSLLDNKRAEYRTRRNAELKLLRPDDFSDDENSDDGSSDSDDGPEPEYNWLDTGRVLRQSVLPALTLPCSPLPAGRGGITQDDGVWTRANTALKDLKPKTLMQVREAFNTYCPGMLGFNGVGQLSVAGLSEMMAQFPETRKGGEFDFLALTFPHIVENALKLTELCRASLEHNAGWYYRRDLHGKGVWFHPKTKQFSRGPPEAVRRVKSMMPSEWVENCALEVLKMLRQGSTDGVQIPREMVTCLLANMFLCTFPATDPEKHMLPARTLGGLLGSRLLHDVHRLRAFVNFFERSLEREKNGKLPPPVDLQMLFKDMIAFGLATSEEVFNMNQFIIMDQATPETYIEQYLPRVEVLRQHRALRRAEQEGMSLGWDEPPPGAALDELSMGELRIYRQHCYRSASDWSRSEKKLLQIQVVPAGDEEDETLLGRTCMTVLSSSLILGGSVLTAKQDPSGEIARAKGRRQYLPTEEEKLYAQRPEMLIACLLCPWLQDGESVHIVGAEQFCHLNGLGTELRYEKTVLDSSPRADDGTVLKAYCCIDPIDACGSTHPWPFASQLAPQHMLRELNKAYAGFKPADDLERRLFRSVATGGDSWGCGSHLSGWGNVELRAVLQWLAACEAGRPMRYFEKSSSKFDFGRRLRTFMLNLTRPRQAINFEKAFRAFDEDGDGDITTMEFSEGLTKLGINLSPQQRLDIIRAFDRDGDGTIDYREFAKQFNSSRHGGGGNHLSRKLTAMLRDRFEALMEEDTEGAAASARAREAALLGGEVYVCVKNCRVRETEEIDSAEVGGLNRGIEVVCLEKVEVDAIKVQEGQAVAEEYRGKKLMRLRIEEPIAGWVSLSLPGGEPQLEPMQQIRNVTVGHLWDALSLLARWMNKPHNASHPQNPLNGAPFLETLQEVVESPEGFMDATKDMRLRVIGCKNLKRADGFMGKSDPYAVIYWNGEKLGTTKTIEDNLNPVWNEDFPITINLEMKNTLRIAVFDYDKVGDHEFLGQVELWGDADKALPVYETDYELGPRTAENGVEMSLAKKLATFDWHVGGQLSLSIGHADEEIKKWGINEYGQKVPLARPKPVDEPDRTKYRICVFTARERGAGTDASVFIQLTGKKIGVRTKRVVLDRSHTKKAHLVQNLFEAGSVDLFEVEELDVGELLKVKIGHDNSGIGPSWLLDKVTVENTSSGVQWLCKCSGNGLWFDHKRGDGKVVRELLPNERTEKKKKAEPQNADDSMVEPSEEGGGTRQVTFQEEGEAPKTKKRGFLSKFGRAKGKGDSDDGTDDESPSPTTDAPSSTAKDPAEMTEKEMKQEEKRLAKEEKQKEKLAKKKAKEEEKAASRAAKLKADEAKAAEKAAELAAKVAKANPEEAQTSTQAPAAAPAALPTSTPAPKRRAGAGAGAAPAPAPAKTKGKATATATAKAPAVEARGQVEDVEDE
jgi:Ca2+-binding EF-hand superfamily protein